MHTVQCLYAIVMVIRMRNGKVVFELCILLLQYILDDEPVNLELWLATSITSATGQKYCIPKQNQQTSLPLFIASQRTRHAAWSNFYRNRISKNK